MSQLLFHNARVLTMDPARPQAEAVAVKDGRIVAGGSASDAANALDAAAERIDCAGGDLVPGFIDAHCHLLGHAAGLLAIDCSEAKSILEIQQLLRVHAASTPKGRWLRAFGYEETALVEKRHPNRQDLDAAAPEHPVRLLHASGHGTVLNTYALRIAGINASTEEPPGSAIGRDESGEPDGVLFNMEHVLDGLLPQHSYEELADAVRAASTAILSNGITCVVDATYTNGRSEWDLFERFVREPALPFDVVLMEGIDHIGEFPESDTSGPLRRGAVKVMLREIGPELSPNEDELADIVSRVNNAGRQVAVHAVGERAVTATVMAIDEALRRQQRGNHRHRIEHCSQLPASFEARIAAQGSVVVSQPLLVYERGDRYRELVGEEQHGSLYAFRTLRDAGVTVAASSDAPVTEPVPLASIIAAVERRTESSAAVAPGQSVSAEHALRWWTAGAAYASFLEHERGAIKPGLRADLVLLQSGIADLHNAAVSRVWIAGNEAYTSRQTFRPPS
jgi:predicted amidohydrolase YtcJ